MIFTHDGRPASLGEELYYIDKRGSSTIYSFILKETTHPSFFKDSIIFKELKNAKYYSEACLIFNPTEKLDLLIKEINSLLNGLYFSTGIEVSVSSTENPTEGSSVSKSYIGRKAIK